MMGPMAKGPAVMSPIHHSNGTNGVVSDGNGAAEVVESPIKSFYAGR